MLYYVHIHRRDWKLLLWALTLGSCRCRLCLVWGTVRSPEAVEFSSFAFTVDIQIKTVVLCSLLRSELQHWKLQWLTRFHGSCPQENVWTSRPWHILSCFPHHSIHTHSLAHIPLENHVAIIRRKPKQFAFHFHQLLMFTHHPSPWGHLGRSSLQHMFPCTQHPPCHSNGCYMGCHTLCRPCCCHIGDLVQGEQIWCDQFVLD